MEKTAPLQKSFKLKHFETIQVIQSKNIQNIFFVVLIMYLELVPLLFIVLTDKNSVLDFIIPEGLKTFMYIFVPYNNPEGKDNFFVFITFVVIITVFLLYAVGYIIIYYKKNKTSITKYYALFLKYIEFGFYIPCSLCLLTFMIKGSNNVLMVDIIIRGVAFLLLLLFLIILYFQIKLYNNFSFIDKEVLKRYHINQRIILKIIEFVIILSNVLGFKIGNQNFPALLNLIYVLIVFVFTWNYYLFYNYNTLIIHYYIKFTFFWTNMLIYLSSIASMKMIRDNFLIILFVGIVFGLYIFLRWKNCLKIMILEKEIKHIKNEFEFDMKLRLFYQIIKESVKNKESEIRLASIVQFHIQNCVCYKCACKRRKTVFDASSLKYGNTKIPVFKDFAFLKNMLVVINNEGLDIFKNSKVLHITLALIQLEILNATPNANSTIIKFETRFKYKLKLEDDFIISFLNKNLDKRIRDFQKKIKHDHIDFEKIKMYDMLFEKLR